MRVLIHIIKVQLTTRLNFIPSMWKVKVYAVYTHILHPCRKTNCPYQRQTQDVFGYARHRWDAILSNPELDSEANQNLVRQCWIVFRLFTPITFVCKRIGTSVVYLCFTFLGLYITSVRQPAIAFLTIVSTSSRENSAASSWKSIHHSY